MRKKFVVALATSLILANGTSVALASGGSDDTTNSSTTIPRTRDNSNLTESQLAAQRAAQQAQQAAQRAAQQAARQAQNDEIARYKAELVKYLESRRTINTTFTRSMVDAQRLFKVARESAASGQARFAATRAFSIAVRAATEARNSALRALGEPPAKPEKP